jgi:hypothetical protein
VLPAETAPAQEVRKGSITRMMAKLMSMKIFDGIVGETPTELDRIVSQATTHQGASTTNHFQLLAAAAALRL